MLCISTELLLSFLESPRDSAEDYSRYYSIAFSKKKIIRERIVNLNKNSAEKE